MRKISCLFIAGFFFVACNNDKKTDAAADKQEDKTDTTTRAGTTELKQTALQVAVKPYEKLLGSFVGPFGTNKITMLITLIAGDSVVGRTIVGGNDRPFRGTFKKEGGFYYFNAKEPGDHKDDGEFNWVMDDTSPDHINGGWKPYAKGRAEKEYQLQRKKFEYRTDVGTWPESSQRLLKPEDVENLMKEDLEFMRNEIFARHGYCFSKKHLRQQFEMEEWYVPNTVDIRGLLTDIEKKNIEMIKRYEKYAEEYGDEYGR